MNPGRGGTVFFALPAPLALTGFGIGTPDAAPLPTRCTRGMAAWGLALTTSLYK